MLQATGATIDLVKEAKEKGVPFLENVDPANAQDTSAFGALISTVLQLVMVIALLSVLIFLIWGGLEWILSGGEKTKVEAARNKITTSIIGLIVLASSVAIYFFIQGILGPEVFTN